MAEVVNLRRARKARDAARNKARADANALKHGQSKAARNLDQARRQQARDLLDAHRRDDAGTPLTPPPCPLDAP